MNIFVVAGLSFFIGLAIASLLWTGTGDYLIDAVIAVLAFAVLTWPAALAIVAIQYSARRLPYPARACANTFGVHPLLVPVLFPGAVEHKTLDTTSSAQPPTPAIAPTTLRQAKRAYEEARRARRITRLQHRNRQFTRQTTGEPRISQTNPVPATAQTIRIYASEAEQIADALGRGEAPSDIAKSLKGYRPEEYKQFKAKVDAVAAALAQQSS